MNKKKELKIFSPAINCAGWSPNGRSREKVRTYWSTWDGGGRVSGGLRPFHQWGHVCLREEKKQGGVNDKLIGGICSPHGSGPDVEARQAGDGMPANPPLFRTPPAAGARLFRERKDLFKWAPSPSDCSHSSRSLTKAGFISTDWDGQWHVLVVFLDIKERMFQDQLRKDSATLPNNGLILWQTFKMISPGVEQVTSYQIC